MEKIILTEELLNQGKSRNGFWSNKQLHALGINEIKKGWKLTIIGKEFSIETIDDFLNLKDKHLKISALKSNSNPSEFNQIIKPDEIILTKEIFAQGKSINGGWGYFQLRALGETEFKKGWKKGLLGKPISLNAVQRFLYLKDKHIDKDLITKNKYVSDELIVVNLDIPLDEQYKKPQWLELRIVVLKRDNYCCTICNKKERDLHVHHLMYPINKFVWEIDTKYLISVCEKCHENIHDRKLTKFEFE